MKVAVDEVWVTPGSLVFRIIIWGNNDEWRQKRYASLPMDDIPAEVLQALVGHLEDAGRDEDPQHEDPLW